MAAVDRVLKTVVLLIQRSSAVIKLIRSGGKKARRRLFHAHCPGKSIRCSRRRLTTNKPQTGEVQILNVLAQLTGGQLAAVEAAKGGQRLEGGGKAVPDDGEPEGRGGQDEDVGEEGEARDGHRQLHVPPVVDGRGKEGHQKAGQHVKDRPEDACLQLVRCGQQLEEEDEDGDLKALIQRK